MDLLSFPSFYLSSPATPGCSSPDDLQFYSTRSTPLQHVDYQNTIDDEFEFCQNYKLPSRSNSFSTMAFADELFSNGEVLPLKLPPRLQKPSPRSMSSRIKNPFATQCTWNDDFDPFMIALEKVSEEGRMSVHRRSRSYSPVRATPCRELETKMFERKGSMYSRWVRSQTAIKNQRHESKMQKVKSVLLRYASVKKETTETNRKREITTILSMSYFKRLSLLLKTHRRKRESVVSKMVVVKHGTKPQPCFGYAPRNPTMTRVR